MENGFMLEPRGMMPVAVLDRSAICELAGDYTLPDYLPEVRRLLRVVPSVQPESRYLGAASAEFGGACAYAVTYAGADGCLWSTQLRENYTVTVPIDADALAHGLEPVADTAVDSIVSRVTGPRKLNIRTRLRTQVKAWGEQSVEPVIEGGEGVPLERLTRECRAMRVLRGCSEPLDLGDEIAPGESTGLRVVRAEGSVHVASVAAGQGEALCRGELAVQLLTVNEIEGMVSEPTAVVRKLPLEARVAMPELTPAMTVRGWGRCVDLAVQVEEGRILCDAVAVVEVEAVDGVPVSLTADAFAPGGELADAVWREVEVAAPLACTNATFSLSGAVSLKSAGIDPAAEVVDVAAAPQVESLEAGAGKCKLSGSCRLSIIYRAGGEYGVGEASLPFAVSLDCDGEATDHAAQMWVSGLRVRRAGEELALDGELCGAIRLFARRRERVLERAVYVPDGGAAGAGVTVCYPEAGESLWSVCRRYHVPCAAVAAANQLACEVALDAPGSLCGARYLLI